MAKLSARGRTVVVAVTRELDAATLQTATDRRVARDYPNGTYVPYGKTDPEPLTETHTKALTTWERISRRLMSDGTVLEKIDVRFQPDWLDAKGRVHSYGWKVHGKIKAGVTPAEFQRIYLAPRKDGRPSPWTLETGAAAPVVISQARILRAVQADDHRGFCQACGAEAFNVEGDASGYPCVSCGKHEVSGAENLLAGIA